MDYAEQADAMIRQSISATGRDAGEGALICLAEAQVYATLALAEEQRTANLLTFLHSGAQMSDETRVGIRAEVRTRLGVNL